VSAEGLARPEQSLNPTLGLTVAAVLVSRCQQSREVLTKVPRWQGTRRTHRAPNGMKWIALRRRTHKPPNERSPFGRIPPSGDSA
jgi:hypothetical protein